MVAGERAGAVGGEPGIGATGEPQLGATGEPRLGATGEPQLGANGEPRLDASQRRVLELGLRDSAIVIGAPGSGKTTTLVQFAVDRVHRLGLDPSALLVLAPSRVAANRLRDRLALRVDRPTNGPLARTVTSVAFSIVQAQATLRDEPAPRLLTGAEQDSIISELLAGAAGIEGGPLWPDQIDAEVRALAGFRTELRELMMRVTEAGLRPGDLRTAGERYDRAEWVATADFMVDYETVIDRFPSPYLDSAELISEATRSIADGAPLGALELLLVDDVQEHGAATLEFLRALAGRGVTVVGFGDPDVAAATFRGSDPLALAEFGRRLGVEAQTITLDTVHRHGDEVRGLVTEISQRIGASGVVEHRKAAAVAETVDPAGRGDGSADADADADAGEGSSIRFVCENTPARLHRRIGRVLREQHLLYGVPWSKMAVVVRSGSLLAPIERSLALSDVPTRGSVGSRTVQDHHAAGHLLTAAAVAVGAEPLTEASAVDLLTGPLSGLDRMALRRLRLALRHEELAGGGAKQGTQLLYEALLTGVGFASVDSTPARRAHRFATTLAEATRLAIDGGSIEEVLWHLWDRSGLAGPWASAALGHGLAADEANRQLDGVMALFTAAKRFVERAPGAPASNFIVEARSATIREDSLTPTSAGEAVWLGTPNTVVGAEVDVVVVAGMQDGVWPNPRVRGTLLYPQEFTQRVAGLPVEELDARASVLSDELRLFELAVSRARSLVVLAAVDSEDEHPSPFLRFPSVPPVETGAAEHPLTLRGMVGHLRREVVAPAADAPADAAAALARLAAAGVPGASPDEWYGLGEPTTTEPLIDLSDAEARVRVSPSQMETFEKTPLAWFIDKMAAMPSGIAANVGTIVHGALENTADAREPSDVTPEKLWEHVDDRWSELTFEAPWIAERQRRAVDTLVNGLSEYLTDFLRSGATLVNAEGAFEVTIDQVTLSGKIDRVERTAEGEIVIVDLKTGRNAPSQPSVDQNAQLGGYQLAGRRGAIPGVEGTEVSAGGALLYVSKGVRGKSYRLLTQKPLTDEELAGFETRVLGAGHGMAAAVFPGVSDLDERDPKAGFVYRIHLVGAVSA
ncbi:Superfamily I DNA or RNA helicase [Okibacterium fritillariae]|uniref:DNA 3'-5' helicase n=1 Tax=Okibacterium fritillariae TaxID=123320 RepID=A0A1T5J2J8_9MICO|nr:Superfamily I DNA or RNA helicase [Okibacterium fritillariae]